MVRTDAGRPRPGHSGGYTLIEMAVVLVILGVILLVMIGRIDYMVPKYRARAAVREVASTLTLARSLAMSTGMPHYVQYDVNTGEYWILAPEPVKDPDEIATEEDSAENAFKDYAYKWSRTMERKLPDNVVFEKILWSADKVAEQMPVTIEVSPYGSMRKHTVWITGKEDSSKFTVTSNPVTGFVEFKEGHVEPAALEQAQD